MNPKKTTILDVMICGALAATVIILHNLIINIYPHISL